MQARGLAIAVLLDVKDIPQVVPLQWGGSPRRAPMLADRPERLRDVEDSNDRGGQ